jgi:hypothetical protein
LGAIATPFAVAFVDTAGRMHRMLLADAEPISHANTLGLTVAIPIAEPDIDAARQHDI